MTHQHILFFNNTLRSNFECPVILYNHVACSLLNLVRLAVVCELPLYKQVKAFWLSAQWVGVQTRVWNYMRIVSLRRGDVYVNLMALSTCKASHSKIAKIIARRYL
jgi:hypothetical protein